MKRGAPQRAKRSLFPASRSQHALGNNRIWFLSGLLLYAAVGVSGLYVTLSSQQMRNLFTSLQRNQAENDQLLGEYSRLLLERSTFSSHQNVGRVAERELFMKFPEFPKDVQRVQR